MAKWVAIRVATILADHKQIDKRTAAKNLKRSAACERPTMKVFGARCLDVILDIIESVSEGFLTYFSSSMRSANRRRLFCLGLRHLVVLFV